MLVTKIDYKSQIISTTDPQAGCLLERFRSFNLLDDFSFSYAEVVGSTDIVLFNCTRREDDDDLLLQGVKMMVVCSSNPRNYQIFGVDPRYSISDPSLLYCTKMFDDFSPYPYDRGDVLDLSWSNPSCDLVQSRINFAG
ncbi:hypothetical protein M5689_019223 [Euphorbia peplus]|nr:hypothetical protein M5689_019223 [Euphorbia peplus]